MALTQNLKMNTIEPSDYVNPQTINDNFNILDKLGIDYITEQGTSGVWTYRKWKSGIAECWGRTEFPATTASGQLPSGVNFPFMFASKPTVAMSAGVQDRSDGYISYVNAYEGGIDCYVQKNETENHTRWVYCYAIGKVSQ